MIDVDCNLPLMFICRDTNILHAAGVNYATTIVQSFTSDLEEIPAPVETTNLWN